MDVFISCLGGVYIVGGISLVWCIIFRAVSVVDEVVVGCEGGGGGGYNLRERYTSEIGLADGR